MLFRRIALASSIVVGSLTMGFAATAGADVHPIYNPSNPYYNGAATYSYGDCTVVAQDNYEAPELCAIYFSLALPGAPTPPVVHHHHDHGGAYEESNASLGTPVFNPANPVAGGLPTYTYSNGCIVNAQYNYEAEYLCDLTDSTS